MSTFTPSKFRKYLIEQAVLTFPEEYGVTKKGLGPKLKLFLQKAWNSSSRTEMNTSEMFIWTIREQMATKSMVKIESL